MRAAQLGVRARRLDAPPAHPAEPSRWALDSGEHRFALELRPGLSGKLDYRVRVYPRNELLTHPFELGLATWLSRPLRQARAP